MTRDVPAPAVRAPKQHRSRLAWSGILDAGIEVLSEVGVARFNVAAVCERAGVAGTAIYSRVDTRDDLLHAVYDHGMAALQSTEARLAERIESPGPKRAVDVLAAVFAAHARFLAPTILGATHDAYLQRRGEENLTRAREVFVREAVGVSPPAHLHRRARTLFAVAFSTLAFDLAFGAQLIHRDPADGAVAQLHLVADALFAPGATADAT